MRSDNGLTLGSFVDLVRGTTYKGALVGKPGPALLGLGSIHPGGGFREEDFKTYGGECPPKIVLGPGDLFASLKGATKDGKMIGSVARVPNSVRSGRLTQDTVKLNFKSDDKDFKKYVYWVLRSPQYRTYCAGRATGSAVVALSRDDFLSYPIPALTEVRMHRVELLEAIEQRLTLLRQTNTTLESIAQALFKSWFIDFDPVRAKAEGCEPEGMDPATAALFPAVFEESALGLIPLGWRSDSFGALATLAKGTVNPAIAPDTTFEHFSLPAFDAGQLPVLEFGANIMSNKTLVPKGAVLQSKLNPHIPRIWYPVQVGDRAVCSTEFLPWVAREGASPELVYCLLRSVRFARLVQTLVTGTSNSHQRVKADQVASLDVVVAPKTICAKFADIVAPLLTKVAVNRVHASRIAELRDTLLPRLISGKLRLPEAQTAMEALS